jgi:cytochrome bd ubiquinol oxidase subunit II
MWREMSLPVALALVLAFSLAMYAVFAGADFGAGILDLLSRGSTPERASIARTISPLWEANHVWLIFSITILFSAFPVAFAALGTTLLAPLTLALLAIVLRAVAFALRGQPHGRERSEARLGALFGAASVAAPLFFGATAGGLAQVSSSPSTTSSAPPPIPWTGVFAAVVGLLAVALCTQLAASFMTIRLARSEQSGLAERFRRRGLQSAASVLILGVLALSVASWKTPALSHRLLGPALPVVIIGLAAIATSLRAFSARNYRIARGGTLLTAAALIGGWMVAQYPRLIGSLTIHTAAASRAALIAIAVAIGIVFVSVLPAMFLLFALFARPLPEEIQ